MTTLGYGICFLLGAVIMAAGMLLERLPMRPEIQKEKERRMESESSAGETDPIKKRLERELMNFLRYDGTEQEEQ